MAATRLPHPWDSPGKNTGVGCHFEVRFFFLFEISLESKIPQLFCGQVENKGKSQCHAYERKEVAFPDTVMYSGLANFSAA